MYFTSAAFLLFFALVLLAYYGPLRRWQWQALLVASFVFYAFSGLSNLAYLALTILSTFFAARKMDALFAAQTAALQGARETLSPAELKAKKVAGKAVRRRWLIGCLVFNFGILAVVKYADFVIGNVNGLLGLLGANAQLGFLGLLLPMGISFYTFQSMGYLIDTYRAKKPGAAEESLARFALFVSFFPQLVQGPISRFGDLKKTLFGPHAFCSADFSDGLLRVLLGFFKKLVVADRLLVAVRALVAQPQTYQGVYVLLAMFFYAVTLYADFTGGIDITIGAARMLGITLKENFDRPFYSTSIAEYWRRWHITMGTWFRDYLFYPLSVSGPMLRFQRFCRRVIGDKVGRRIPVYVCTMIVWFATGLWHGASWNFIVWGLLNGVVIVVSQECTPLYAKFHARFAFGQSKIYHAFCVVRTFVLMAFIRTFDIYAGVGVTVGQYASVFTNPSLGQLGAEGLLPLGLSAADYAVAALGTAVLAAVGVIHRRYYAEKRPGKTACAAMMLALFFAVLVFGMYGVGYDANQFIYNQF